MGYVASQMLSVRKEIIIGLNLFSRELQYVAFYLIATGCVKSMQDCSISSITSDYSRQYTAMASHRKIQRKYNFMIYNILLCGEFKCIYVYKESYENNPH